MRTKILAACVVVTCTANAAYAGTCTASDRYANIDQKIDVNIKVKNDTDQDIKVSIWKGTATDKKTVLVDGVYVPSDGKEGKTDKNVTDANFYFSAKRHNSKGKAVCTFWAYRTTTQGVFAGDKSYIANIDSFDCPDKGDFKISCEKGFDKNKQRWNVTYSLR
jgi:hypothetical protein